MVHVAEESAYAAKHVESSFDDYYLFELVLNGAQVLRCLCHG